MAIEPVNLLLSWLRMTMNVTKMHIYNVQAGAGRVRDLPVVNTIDTQSPTLMAGTNADGS